MLTILQKTFEEANRTLDWLSTVHCKPTVADIFNIGMKYSYRDEPYTSAVFDEQHISSFKSFLFLELLVRDILRIC
jgi:hypothetical protein